MTKEIVVDIDDYPPISEWENEGGPPIDAVYKFAPKNEPNDDERRYSVANPSS